VDFKENIIKTLQIFTDCKPLEILRRWRNSKGTWEKFSPKTFEWKESVISSQSRSFSPSNFPRISKENFKACKRLQNISWKSPETQTLDSGTNETPWNNDPPTLPMIIPSIHETFYTTSLDSSPKTILLNHLKFSVDTAKTLPPTSSIQNHSK
jgi:hypothetical protein